MAQESRPWQGDVNLGALGDAGPYTSDQWTLLFEAGFPNKLPDFGVFYQVDNELVVTTTPGPPDTVLVNTGVGICDGKFYFNDASYSEVMPVGAAGTYYVVLQKIRASQTVRVDIRTGALTQTVATWEVPLATFALDGSGNVTGLTDLRNFVGMPETEPGGRLTLTSGTPVTIPNVSAATTVYYTPYVHDRIQIYDDGGRWQSKLFSELSVSVPATTTRPFDIFIYVDAFGELNLETLNWTNDTTRATLLTRQDGRLVQSGDATRFYLGTGRTTGVSGQTESSIDRRFLWNYYNRVTRRLALTDTSSTSYDTSTWTYYDLDNTNILEFIIGVEEAPIRIHVVGKIVMAGMSIAETAGVGYDVDAATAPQQHIEISGDLNMRAGVSDVRTEGEGYHFLALIWLGDTFAGSPPVISGFQYGALRTVLEG